MLGTATAQRDRFVVNQKDMGKNEELTSQITDTRKWSSASSVTRQRSGSLSSVNGKLNQVFDDEAASEIGNFSRPRSEDSPSQIRRSSNSWRLLEARRSVASSALDLRNIDEDSPAVFSHSDVTSFMEYSSIQTTVRRVSRAFSGSSPSSDKVPQSEAQMRTAQTRYIVESRNSPEKDTSISTSDSSHHNLDELLASIDRDLDETRHTISCAQLLESALLVKNDGRPPAKTDEPTDSLRYRRVPRIMDFSDENSGASLNGFNFNRTTDRQNQNLFQDETNSNTKVYSKLERKVTDFNTKPIVEANQAVKSEGESEVSQSISSADSKPQEYRPMEPAHIPENREPKKRVFELFADSNCDKNKQLTTSDSESSSETSAHAITPRKSTLPSVYKMARQYSQLVSDKQTVEDIRMRTRNKQHDKAR